RVSPTMAVMVVVTTALNGIALLRVYFRLFTGTDHKTSISIQGRPSEKWAVVALTLLIIGGGLWPQPGVASRYDVARQIVNLRSVPRPSSGKPVPQLAEPVVATSVPSIPRE